MAITWTIIVLGALLHGMASTQTNPTAKPSMATPQSDLSTLSTDSSATMLATKTKMTTVLATTSGLAITTGSATLATTLTTATVSSLVTTPGGSVATPGGSVTTAGGSVTRAGGSVTTAGGSVMRAGGSVTTAGGSITTLKSPTQSGSTVQSTPQPTLQPGSAIQTTPLGSATSATKPVETTSATPTVSAAQPSASLSTIPLSTPEPSNQSTTGKKTNTGSPTHLLSTEAPSSRSPQTLKSQTTSVPSSSVPITSTPKTFKHPSFNLSSSSEGSIVLEACKTLGQKMKGNCSVEVTINGNQLIATVTIDADQAITSERYQPLEKKEEINKVAIPDTLIAILASCGALVLILCCFAAYCTYHRRSYRKNQQHLTEELQTVENGYHDNPTLEVMEVQPEMQEKKLTLNGEFNDSWIVPIDNLLKDDIPDEEDTHL